MRVFCAPPARTRKVNKFCAADMAGEAKYIVLLKFLSAYQFGYLHRHCSCVTFDAFYTASPVNE